MVDVSYQMVLSTLQTVGLLVGIFYYVMTLRNAQKNRMIDMVLQRMQNKSNPEWQKMAREIGIMRYGWSTPQEFHQKYNFLKNRDLLAKQQSIVADLSMWGFLLREGAIGEEFIDRMLTPFHIIWNWEGFEPIFMKEREEFRNPKAYKDFEYLYKVVKKKYPHISKDTKFSFDIMDQRLELEKPKTNP